MKIKIFQIFIYLALLEFIATLFFGIALSQPSSDSATNNDINLFDIISRNLLVCIILVVGFFSLGIISFVLWGLNGVTFGAIFKQYWIENTPLDFLLSILPHGIFEIPALILSVAIGTSSWYYLFKYLSTGKFHIKPDMKFYMKLILIIILLLFLGALAEYFITFRLVAN